MLSARVQPPRAVFTACVIRLGRGLETTAVGTTMVVWGVHPVTWALAAACSAGLQGLVIDIALNVSRVCLRKLLPTFLFH